MDGNAVDTEHRGQGGYTTIRLDVIDTNPGARRLYERLGFMATRSANFPCLRRFLGFGSATTMEYNVRTQSKPTMAVVYRIANRDAWNTDGGEELFPHIYGPLNCDAIVAAEPLTRGADGLFAAPPCLQSELERGAP